jgi:hypothetical protein
VRLVRPWQTAAMPGEQEGGPTEAAQVCGSHFSLQGEVPGGNARED